jgi:hypothetical protein
VFEHVSLLLSFVYALALTHLLSSATELVIPGKRVRFSGLYTLWAINAAALLMVNWIAIYSLTALKQWTPIEVFILFFFAVAQYFTCSTFRVSEHEKNDFVDLPRLYEQRRLVIFGAFLVLGVIALFENWWDRDNQKGIGPSDWIGEDLSIVPMIVAVLCAGLARPKWLQWVAGAAMFGLNLFFFLHYTIAAG